MFWGLIMEPQKRYTQTVKKSFHVSMAALDISSSTEDPTQVICAFEDRNYLLCTLRNKNILQVPLDLNFEVGDKVSFATNGKSHVHLTGYLIEDEPDDSKFEDSDEPAISPILTRKRLRENDTSPPKKKSKVLEMLEEAVSNDDESDDPNFEVTDMDMSNVSMENVEEESEDDEEEEEEADGDEDEEDDDDEDVDEEEDLSDEMLSDDDSEEEKDAELPKDGESPKENGVQSKKQMKVNDLSKPKKQEKKNKTEQIQGKTEKVKPKGDKTSSKLEKTPGDKIQATPQKRTIEGGVIVEDVKLGNGQVAKQGKLVQVYYEGRLKHNNKVFDSTMKGAGFRFRLGKQEVIKGWDVGVAGMKVGGKRRITCPPNMAYGQKGSPPVIPPNSTLVFEVELKNTS